MTHLSARTASTGKKKLLTLDGGGIRGLISVEVLAEIERTLRRELEAGEDFRLADYFDFVAGTSTGAIIAACVSLGMSVDEIRTFYLSNGRAMFDKASLLRRFHYKYEDAALAEKLREVFNAFLTPEELRAGTKDLKLGSPALRTLLCAVMRNASTDSPWPVTNNPQARYNDRALKDCNLDIPLWQLIRASTAAPTYFPPEVLQLGEQSFLFVDGGITTYNNPAFHAFMNATIPAYRLEWEAGVDRMLIISVGTGTSPGVNAGLDPDDLNLLYNIGTIPSALMAAALNQQDMLCRAFGRCKAGDELDGELGTMIFAPDAETSHRLPKLFTYARYNAELTTKGLTRLGLPQIEPANVQRLDSIEHLDDLRRVGEAVGRQVSADHFAGFV